MNIETEKEEQSAEEEFAEEPYLGLIHVLVLDSIFNVNVCV